jgi:hypothetical protein
MTTISTQRGTIAASGGICCQATLFTNSGSVNATRVITNGVMQYMSSGLSGSNYGYFGGEILVMPSGNCSGSYIVGRAVSGCSAYIQNAQYLSDYRATSAMPYCMFSSACCGTICTGCLFAIQSQVQYGTWCNSGSLVAGCGVSNQSTFAMPYVNPTVSGWSGFATIMPQFWIGPSDLVKWQGHCNIGCYYVPQGKGGYAGVCSCVNVMYSFTTVSE